MSCHRTFSEGSSQLRPIQLHWYHQRSLLNLRALVQAPTTTQQVTLRITRPFARARTFRDDYSRFSLKPLVSVEASIKYKAYTNLVSDSTNKYASAEVGQTLDSFDVLAKLLKQRMAVNQQNQPLGGLSAMIISGTLYVAVLQAILVATVLLQSDEDSSNSDRSSNNSQNSNSMFHLERRPSGESQSTNSNAPQSISNLDCILNLTKMEYYITVFNQYLQFFFSVSTADSNSQGSSPIFDYRACIDTTESVQSRVRLLLLHSRQSM